MGCEEEPIEACRLGEGGKATGRFWVKGAAASWREDAEQVEVAFRGTRTPETGGGLRGAGGGVFRDEGDWMEEA